MTNEEANEWCFQFMDNLLMNWKDEKKYLLAGDAIHLCKEALKKRIPKKPTQKEKTLAWVDRKGCCPSCGNAVNGKMQYCDNCGQALDWSEDD